jgi:ATP synthase protein I
MKAGEDKELNEQIERQAERMRKADRARPTLMAQTVYLGTLGLVFVLPVIGGAYLGHWLDNLSEGYSMRWTLSLIFLGLVVGAVNAWLMLRE